ncbi:PhoH family protein [Candidatus Neomarinimicrobiota bacterium]
MSKHVFDIQDTDPLLLFGVNDRHLEILEATFDVSVLARGNKITLEGDDDVLNNLKRVLKDMIVTINRKGALTEDDVHVLAELPADGNSVVSEDKPVILYTQKGTVTPRTPGQLNYYNAALEHDIVFVVGPAGTGKTYQAVAVAIAALKSRLVERIILTRPAVEAGERLGFLPGDLKEKIDPYLTPLYDALQDMLPFEKVKAYLEQRIIEIAPLAYMRGRTLSSAYVILDEAQNATPLQMKMFLTRLGVNSRAIITGDITQIDLPGKEGSGLVQATQILDGIDGIAICQLNGRDVVRHRLVREIIQAYQEEQEQENQN